MGGEAFGSPGIEPKWTASAKEAVGTAYSASSRIWFTIAAGMLTEVYYPTIDRPQIRDLQYLVTDGKTFFHDSRRHQTTEIQPLDEHSLGFRIVKADPEGRYRIEKEVVADPHHACILVRTSFVPRRSLRGKLRLFALLAPHLEVGGAGNTGLSAETAGRRVLAAHKGETWLALGATTPFLKRSCGFVGRSDGWTDLAGNFEMDWEFETATNGNIALTAELDVADGKDFTLGLSFGSTLHGALSTLGQALGFPFESQRRRYRTQWSRACRSLAYLDEPSGDGGTLYRSSRSLLLAHEDKTYPGAMIASMSIPWGEAKGDDDLGGYHLVWTRDMVNSALGLLASGHTETPLRSLIYLASSQRPDGGFAQNFWIDGTAYWTGIQLDEVAFPILLAWRLHEHEGLEDFDPYPMVLRAAGYLIREGPETPQERWEENGGYSPSTLASNIAALTCAASFCRARGDETTGCFLQEYADFLESHVESWTVTTKGTLLPGVPRHYLRIHPADPFDPIPHEDPDEGTIRIKNRPPGARCDFPSTEIVDAGFLELVRYGIRKGGDPLVEDSLRVIDACLEVDTPFGPCWRRYNHDGYGQRDDGGPFDGWGKGRAWPLLTGERGHYELAAGRDPLPYLHAMERFANGCALLPEQVWDAEDRPELRLWKGRPTGSAMPLCWAHAEYIKLLRSIVDEKVFDLLPVVADRYQGHAECLPLEVWKTNRQIQSMPAGKTLRIQAPGRFRLRWTKDEWKTFTDSESNPTAVGIDFFDIDVPEAQRAPVRFTFFWTGKGRWEGRNYAIVMA